MADRAPNTKSQEKTPGKAGFNRRAGKRRITLSDWSKKLTFDGQEYTVLPPVRLDLAEPCTTCRWSPEATRDENVTAHDARNRKLRLNLMKAVLMLSQTVEGRRNMQTLRDLGYQVRFDTETCVEKQALGLCRFDSKEILLSEKIDTPERLALVLNHEAAHARLGQGIKPDSSIRLDDQMLVVNVHEAHARASEVKVALELMVGYPKGPETQFRTTALIRDIKERYPGIARAALFTGAQTGDIHDGQAMADAFIAYFAQGRLRQNYEKRHTGWLGDLKVDVLKGENAHRKRVDTDGLKAMLKDGNVPYLERHRPNVDLSQPRYSGVSRRHHAAFRKAWKRLKKHRPLGDIPAPQIAVYPPYPKPGLIDTIKAALVKERKFSLPGFKP